MMTFTGKTIVITGASDGIGAELARQLSAEKPNLVLAARGLDRLQLVAAQCEGLGANVRAVKCDVSIEADCKALMDAAVSAYGGVDVLVNNAGVSGHALFSEVSDFSWYEQMMRVNFFGSLWCTRYALPHIKAARGLVVGVSSLAGKVGVPGRTAYSASKFAMDGFFSALRLEVADAGVDVCMIFPGVVATNIRLNGYDANGKAAGVSGLVEDGAMSVEECARQMLEALRARKRELVMTTKGRIGLILKTFAPSLVDNMARKAVKNTH